MWDSPELPVGLEVGQHVVLPEAEEPVDHVDDAVLDRQVAPRDLTAAAVVPDVH